MNELTLSDMLAEVRAEQKAWKPRRGPALPGCLSFSRAEAVALNSRAWTSDERRHHAACSRCERLVQQFLADAHVSAWTLIRRGLGQLAPEEQQAAAAHEAVCGQCATRAAVFESPPERLVRFAQPVPLRNPAAVHAAPPSLELSARSSDGMLEAELVEEEDALTLEVRTRDESLNGALAAYLLRGRQAAEEGFLLLRPDVDRWYGAIVKFDAAALYAHLGGECEQVLVSPLEAGVLGEGDRERLLDAAERDRDDQAARAAWEAWLERTRGRE